MLDVQNKLESIDWVRVSEAMHNKGYAVVPGVFSKVHCQHFIDQYDNSTAYRKTVVMERYRFGRGEYKYFAYPLPDIIQRIRETVYPKLVPIANLWMNQLEIDKQFPLTYQSLLAECKANQQLKPTPLILKYGRGDFNTLHQDLYGEVYFPMQAVFLLNDPTTDFSGGELVLTQQTPRAQSKAMVVNLKLGDMVIFTTYFRPVRGTRGYYRAPMKHGVSEVHSGQRHTLGVIFHDATS